VFERRVDVPRSTAPRPPQWGIRLKVGIVTYFNDEPLETWEQAQQAREAIHETTGEFGDVEKVYVLT
jgi:hypothetical protein